MAVLAAFMMVAVAGIVIFQSSDESEAAAGEAGYMNVYINSGSGWSVETVLAANGCEAVKATGAYDSHNDEATGTYRFQTDTADERVTGFLGLLGTHLDELFD